MSELTPADFGTKIIASISPQGVVRWTEKGTPVPYTRKPKK